MVEAAYYTSKEIAEITGFSIWWVFKWRKKIVGAKKYGRDWRFAKELVDRRIAAGKDVRAGI